MSTVIQTSPDTSGQSTGIQSTGIQSTGIQSTGVPTPAAADPFCVMADWLRSACRPAAAAPKCIGMTSCTNGAGVTSLAQSLAMAAARTRDQSVLLLDLSGRDNARPRPAAQCEATRESTLRANVEPTSVKNLSLLSVADVLDLRAVAADKNCIADLLRTLENDFETIFVDLPPVSSSLCFETAGLLGGMLLVMESERTPRDVAVRAKQRLLDAGAAVLGVILNKQR